ncbi:MAG: hypothetical protein ACRCYU_22695, partial [Nocardioides sp.]
MSKKREPVGGTLDVLAQVSRPAPSFLGRTVVREDSGPLAALRAAVAGWMLVEFVVVDPGVPL